MTPRAACAPRSRPISSGPSGRPILAVTASVALLGLVAAGCHNGGLEGRASSPWTRTYTLQDGGEFQVVGAVGTIDVQGGTGSTVEVTADRIVRAASNEGAASLAPKVRITEDVSPARVVLRTEGLGGIIVGIEIVVDYHAKVPSGTRLRLHTNDGDISVANVSGALVASSTNGTIGVREISGGVELRTTNGALTADVSSVSADPIDLRTTNGEVTLSLPPRADVTLDARCTNGTIDVAELPVQLTGEQQQHRLRGRLNAGGTPVSILTTNGGIRIRPRQ